MRSAVWTHVPWRLLFGVLVVLIDRFHIFDNKASKHNPEFCNFDYQAVSMVEIISLVVAVIASLVVSAILLAIAIANKMADTTKLAITATTKEMISTIDTAW